MALVWLMDLDVGGRTLRLSTRPVDYTDPETGRAYQYRGTLDSLEFEESLGLGGDSVSAREVTVDALPGIDLAALASYAHDLASGTATLRLWDDSEGAYMAEVYMRDARVTLPDFGGDNEVMSFTLSAEPYDDTSAILDADALVSSSTWPTAPGDSEGLYYPRVWGKPGIVTGATRTTIPAAPAIAVETVEDDSFLLYNSSVLADLNGNYNLLPMASGTPSTLYTGMEVLYEDNGGAGIPELTDGSTYFVKLVNSASSPPLYRLYPDSSLSEWIELSNNTPTGTESLTISQPYASKILISDRAVAAATITAFPGFSGDYRLSGVPGLTVVNEEDGLGRTVATVDVSAIGAGTAAGTFEASYRLSSDWRIAWSGGFSGYSQSSPGSVETVGDLLRDLVKAASIEVDHSAWAVLASSLPYSVGYWVQDPDESALSPVLDIVGLLPVGLYSSGLGLAAVAIETEATQRSAIELIEGINAHRSGPLSFVNRPEDMVSIAKARYALDTIEDYYVSRRVLRVQPRDALASTSSDVFVRSSSVAGERRSRLEELDWTYGSAAAREVARWMVRESSVSPRAISLDVPWEIGRALRLGTVITYTAPGLSISSALGIVRARFPSDLPMWRVEVLFLDGVMSDAVESPGGSSTDRPTPGTGN